MKPTKLFTGILALFLLLFAAVGCERDTSEDFGNAVFNVLNEDGTPISTKQIFHFNTSSSLKIEAKNVAGTNVTVPAGWSCEVDIPKRTITVTSPDGAYQNAAVEGDIVITAKGVNGSTTTATVSVEAVDAEVTLECTNADLSEPVILAYAEKKTLTFEATNVDRIEISEAPAGWKVEQNGFELSVTAPSADNEDADEEGEVEIKPYSRRGTKGASVIVKLSVAEAPIELKCNEDISDEIVFRLSDTKTFTFTASANIVSVTMTGAPKGWTVTPDLANMKLDISLPAQVAPDMDMQGSIVLTPISNRGTEGIPVTIGVKLNATAPVLEFDITEQRFGLDQTVNLSVTQAINVANITFKSAPQGWSAVADFSNTTYTITSPTALAGNASGGKVVFTGVSASQETIDVEVEVSLYGINTAEEFIEFGNAVTAGTSLDAFMLGGEVNLFADVDLSQAGRDVLAGTVGKPFAGIFNGNGKTITMRITASGADAGLFHTLAAGAIVKDLKLAGGITSNVPNANIGGVAIYNDGAELNGISSSVTLNYSGATNGGHYGGLVANSRGSGVKYANCHTSGTLTVNGIQYFGGLIGFIAPDTEGVMTDCSNAGNITLNYGALNTEGAYAAGCVGNTNKTKWTFTRVSNTGNINYNFGKAATKIAALGGSFGSACGTYIECFNTGDVIDTDGAESKLAERFIGGFAGTSSTANYPIKASKCYNAGQVTGISNYIGGFMGAVRNCEATTPHELTDCSNSGDVTVVSNSTISGMFGGFLSVSYKSTRLTGCSNSGKVIGRTNRSVGGLVGCGADDLIIDRCENSGMVYVGARADLNPRSGRPFVGGLVAIRGANPVKISNSKNTGTVTAMVHDALHVQSVYVSEIVAYDGKPDVTVCDQATKTASAGATIKAILVAEWSETLPE
ncbi:hypothetical protein [uncultured Alistipes sp.]|jgi:lipoprotein|uniref:hypothetical protein n=1 Tax=uncultured Alistipes sp. TaxID=538949 RepID=UPI0025E334C8|nr:hypothetical protein [uncultured Alistipes sp.]